MASTGALSAPPAAGSLPHLWLADAFWEALVAARGFEGATAPNPPVGCVLLDREGEVLARGAHRRAGEPHAEADAIAACRAAGTADRIHTALVTLEPCSHARAAGCCADALLSTPVRAVWIGALDPHPRAPGAGVARLRAAGVAVGAVAELDDPRARRLAADAARLVAPFGTWARTGRPFVQIKAAMDASGSMIPPRGQTTFTSRASLTHAHALRRRADAILTGSGTVLADAPAFTVRHVEDHPGKRRRLVVLDRRGRTPDVWLHAAAARGLDAERHLDLPAALDALGAAGVLTVLVEAGPAVRRAVLDAGLWDEEVLFRSPAVAAAPDLVFVRRREAAAAKPPVAA